MSTQSVSASAQFTYPAAAASTPSYFPVPFHLQNAQYTTAPAAPVPAYAIYPMPQVQQVRGGCASSISISTTRKTIWETRFNNLRCR
jgi:hypothetical protein